MRKDADVDCLDKRRMAGEVGVHGWELARVPRTGASAVHVRGYRRRESNTIGIKLHSVQCYEHSNSLFELNHLNQTAFVLVLSMGMSVAMADAAYTVVGVWVSRKIKATVHKLAQGWVHF